MVSLAEPRHERYSTTHYLPAAGRDVGLAGPIAGDAVSGADKPPEFLDVEMNHVTGVIVDIPLQGCRGG